MQRRLVGAGEIGLASLGTSSGYHPPPVPFLPATTSNPPYIHRCSHAHTHVGSDGGVWVRVRVEEGGKER